MSTISVDNARPSAGGTAYSLTSGSSKFWAYFDGTGTAAIQDSNNASSLTDNSTGDFTVGVLNDFAAEPAVTLGVGHGTGASGIKVLGLFVTAVRVVTFATNTGAFVDYSVNTVSGMGDLA